MLPQPLQQPAAVLVLIGAALLLTAATGVHGGVLNNRYQQQQAQPPADLAATATATNYRSPLDRSRQPNYNHAQPPPQADTARKQNPPLSSVPGAAGGLPPKLRPGLSAWGLITLIVFVILVGMAGYYGIMCYPLFCPTDSVQMYDTMRETSSTSSGTPLGNYENEKLGNYSSRSTTPSKSHE